MRLLIAIISTRLHSMSTCHFAIISIPRFYFFSFSCSSLSANCVILLTLSWYKMYRVCKETRAICYNSLEKELWHLTIEFGFAQICRLYFCYDSDCFRIIMSRNTFLKFMFNSSCTSVVAIITLLFRFFLFPLYLLPYGISYKNYYIQLQVKRRQCRMCVSVIYRIMNKTVSCKRFITSSVLYKFYLFIFIYSHKLWKFTSYTMLCWFCKKYCWKNRCHEGSAIKYISIQTELYHH